MTSKNKIVWRILRMVSLVEYEQLKSVIHDYISRKGIDGFISLLSMIEDESYHIAAMIDLKQIEELREMNLPPHEDSQNWKELGFDIDKIKGLYFGTHEGKIRK
jgi:hypothetical protein